MLAQDVRLVRYLLWRPEEVAGVRIPGHQPQRLSLATPADQDPGRGQLTGGGLQRVSSSV